MLSPAVPILKTTHASDIQTPLNLICGMLFLASLTQNMTFVVRQHTVEGAVHSLT